MVQQPCRSPLLLAAADSVLLLVDAQDRFLSLLPDEPTLRWNMRRLAEGAQVLGVPCLATEQYPEKLGPTTEELLPYIAFPSPLREEGIAEVPLGEEQPRSGAIIPGKLTFSCLGCQPCWESLQQIGRRQIVLAGLETHVCVQQTALDLLAEGFDVYLTVDAVGARGSLDHRVAVRRMAAAGVTPTTTESVLFEWCERAGTDEFKRVSEIVRRPPPQRKDA
jgi:nicotinamidase-related amidase